MSKYIDYNAINYRNDRLHDKSEEFLNGVIYMAQRIEEAPIINIVFCKDCKHKYVTGVTTQHYVCDFMDAQFDENGYCHHGERIEK